MIFDIKLLPPDFVKTDSAAALLPIYDPELDDVSSVLYDICGVLDEKGYKFLARVLDEEPWPVSLQWELVIVLEQLPRVLVAFTENQACSLDFYEQGIERFVTFSPIGASVAVERLAVRAPEAEALRRGTAPRTLVEAELLRLGHDVLRASSITCPLLAAHPWFAGWASELRLALLELATAQTLRGAAS